MYQIRVLCYMKVLTDDSHIFKADYIPMGGISLLIVCVRLFLSMLSCVTIGQLLDLTYKQVKGT